MIKDVAYAEADPAGGRGHLLDLYLPEERAVPGAPRPLVIWSSGSAWLSDDGKAGAEEAARHFTAAGFAVAGVSVRSSSQARFPAQLHDVKAAVRFLRAGADRFGLDPERFAIMGNSSGGWVAAMAAVTSGMPELEGEVGVRGPSSRVQAAVDFYGPTDFLRMDEHMPPGARERFNAMMRTTDGHNDPRSPESRLVGAPVQEHPDEVRRADPTRYAARGTPPLLLLHGQADPLVPENQSALLFEAVRRAGGRATFHSLPGVGHEHPYVTDPARAAGQTVRWTEDGRDGVVADAPPPTWETIERFVRKALRLPEPATR
ncbi:alpha/beta fold hydrolase [Actinomadura rugatobispora]|uniref:Alpha/beta fold hydrolase n=1 Tax=Actinomadura rugatobispora TaxID=1994 RepID=A0ABW1A2J9_9ACTN